jgi:broad specificity phosphatase PhoE
LSRLLLVRHGETTLNSSQRFWGKTDVALGSTGICQAESLRDRLSNEKIDWVYSSELQRTVSMAETLAMPHQLQVIKCAQLNEIDFGKLEGLDYKEISEQFPDIVHRWTQRDPALQYPGGESLFQMEARVKQFRNLLNSHNESSTILIVAHSAILRTFICDLLGLDMSFRWSLRLDLASLSIVETYPEINILSLLNDVSHLEKRIIK